ncbi:hypothetical protein [Micromonospora tarensis]|uniref:ANTAR domain-containing protein n=1 Tax=Micromonospora tarensis TaxID=2806100 RepID=A0ABS1YPX3_9ACTN|nr:hypothetical protein [Micromonospora tarensis]MBM0279475.1 hypothetical protein [Micromonospora tarensis]
MPDDPAAIVARTVLLLGLLEDEGLTDRELDEILVSAAHAVHDPARHADGRPAGAPVEPDGRLTLPSPP